MKFLSARMSHNAVPDQVPDPGIFNGILPLR